MKKIKETWKDTRINSGCSESAIEDIINGKRITALQKLSKRYLHFSNIALIMLATWLPLFLITLRRENVEHYIGITVALGIFLIVCSAMDRWLYYGVKGIDVMTMPMTEVAEKAVFYRKRHLQFIMILLPSILVILSYMAYSIDNEFSLIGMLVGGLCGLGIGIAQLMKFMHEYSDLM